MMQFASQKIYRQIFSIYITWMNTKKFLCTRIKLHWIARIDMMQFLCVIHHWLPNIRLWMHCNAFNATIFQKLKTDPVFSKNAIQIHTSLYGDIIFEICRIWPLGKLVFPWKMILSKTCTRNSFKVPY